jgi:simple sugar transport system ATP-binding protein
MIARAGDTGEGGASAPPSPLLEAIQVSKSFGSVQANHAVDFDVGAGEIHALIGENGAGKSTLMNVLFGHVTPDEGALKVRGMPVELRSPQNAMAHGIGLVHQHFSLVPTLTVAENVALGSPRNTRLILKRGEIEEKVKAAAEALGWSFDLDAIVGELPVEARQRVEILKVLAPDPDVLLFDEPTALLAPPEIVSFLDVLRRIRSQGKAVVLVTHKLAEVMAVADRVTVLRGGRRVWTKPLREVTEEGLGEAVAGGRLATPSVGGGRKIDRSAVVLGVENVVFTGRTGNRALDDITVSVAAGEIVGIAGVEGNGQQELFEILTGLAAPDSGRRLLDGVDVTGWQTRRLRQAGVGMVPADRKGSGILPTMTLIENLAIGGLAGGGSAGATITPWRRSSDSLKAVQGILDEYDVRPARPTALAGGLSGGNQQKLLLARELTRDPSALVASNPTWGLDIKARAAVHEHIRRARNDGCAVLFSSLELIFGGRIILDALADDLNVDEVAFAMVGKRAQEAA